MLCLRIMIRKGEIDEDECNSLIKREVAMDKVTQPPALKFFTESAWAGIVGLDKNVAAFNILCQTME